MHWDPTGVAITQVTSAKQEAGGAIQEGLDQELLAKIVASAIDAVIVIDSLHRVVLLNGAAARMLEIPAKQALGQPVAGFIPELFRDANLAEPDESARQVELRVTNVLRSDGGRIPVEISISVAELGEKKFYAVILRDVSERLRAEEALRETGQRFLLAVETAQLGTYERDLVNNEVHLNDACRGILGLSQGAPPPDIAPRSAHPEDKERVLTAVARAFDPTLREVCAAEFRILRPDGTVRWVSGRGRVVFDDTVTPARPRKFLGVLLDITELKLAEAELLQAKHELTLANVQLEQRVIERTNKVHEMMAELEHMSYSMIHDMRAPLRAIESFGGILEHDPQVRQSEEAHQLVIKMQIASRRMDQLLTGALNYSDTVRKPLPVAPTNVQKLLCDLLAAQPDFKPPQAEVLLEGAFPWVLGNEAALAQCFAEFIRNGIKFVGHGKRPVVRVWADLVQSPQMIGRPGAVLTAAATTGTLEARNGDWVRLWFEDNGTGIPKHGRARIFELFQRMHGPEYPGAGVGLALVRKLVGQMNGYVGVESEKGKGSRFWLELPRSSAPQGEKTAGTV